MMNRKRANILLYSFLIAGANNLSIRCAAQTVDDQTVQSSFGSTFNTNTSSTNTTSQGSDDVNVGSVNKQPEQEEPNNTIGIQLLKNLVSDQKAIWSSPRHLRWADGAWLFPLAAATAGFFATDRAVPPALSSNPIKLNRYVNISNYGLYSMIGAGGGLYIWSKVSHDDHQRETGILAGEAAIDSYAVDTAFKYAFGRQRPDQGQGLGRFYQGGVSFPSDHSAVAWSIASVIAHEYPGPLTQVAVYGLATAVSASRVLGKQHFPSDVVVGGAIGWLIGRQVYRAHHTTQSWEEEAGALYPEWRKVKSEGIATTWDLHSFHWIVGYMRPSNDSQHCNTSIVPCLVPSHGPEWSAPGSQKKPKKRYRMVIR